MGTKDGEIKVMETKGGVSKVNKDGVNREAKASKGGANKELMASKGGANKELRASKDGVSKETKVLEVIKVSEIKALEAIKVLDHQTYLTQTKTMWSAQLWTRPKCSTFPKIMTTVSTLFRFGLGTETPIKGSDSEKSQVEGTRSFRDWAEQLKSPTGPQLIASRFSSASQTTSRTSFGKLYLRATPLAPTTLNPSAAKPLMLKQPKPPMEPESSSINLAPLIIKLGIFLQLPKFNKEISKAGANREAKASKGGANKEANKVGVETRA